MNKEAATFSTLLTFALALIGSLAMAGETMQPAPANPHMAQSWNPVAHVDPAQTDTFWHPFPVPPKGTSRRLQADELRYEHAGIGNFGAMSSAQYPDGSYVIWSNGRASIRKEDTITGKLIAEVFVPGIEVYPEDKATELNEYWEENGAGLMAIYKSLEPMNEIASLTHIYTLVDTDNNYLVVDGANNQIIAYTDEVKGDPQSGIVVAKTYDMPAEFKGAKTVGFNMTYDGWLAMATYDGRLLLIKKDFSEYRSIRLNHSLEENSAEFEGAPVGYGWVRNAPAIGPDNSFYIVSYQHLHKVVWDGDKLSVDKTDGAWTVKYPHGRAGSGSTPSLVGFGPDEDRFVAFASGEDVMQLYLVWRDDIPENWKGLPSKNRRIAGVVRGDMGDPDIEKVQSEQSVITFGYGVFIVNNYPQNVPWFMPSWGHQLITSYLANKTKYQPKGIMKAEWSPARQEFYVDWAHPEVSSPNMVPTVLGMHNMVLIHGANENDEYVTRAFVVVY